MKKDSAESKVLRAIFGDDYEPDPEPQRVTITITDKYGKMTIVQEEEYVGSMTLVVAPPLNPEAKLSDDSVNFSGDVHLFKRWENHPLAEAWCGFTAHWPNSEIVTIPSLVTCEECFRQAHPL